MKIRTALLLAALLASRLAIAADNPNMGTWKLNEAKSKLSAGAPRNHTVKYEAAGDQIKVTVDGTDDSGKPTHNEWTGKFDGKPYPVSGLAARETRAYTQAGARTLRMVEKQGGKTTLTSTITVAANGKSRTVTVGGTGPDGKKMSSSAVYDKQ
jgi:hypothetical protein